MEIFIIFTLLFGFVFGEDEVLQLDQGKLTGSILRSRNGREFKAFQGIPYAKSPTGDLRFKVNHTFLQWKLNLKLKINFLRNLLKKKKLLN